MSKKKKIAFGCLGTFVLAVLGLALAAMAQPDDFRVERSRTIPASPEAIRAQLTDLNAWAEWNPWADLDPDSELSFSDPASGEGAWYSWSGNDDVGKGKMTITDISDDRVAYELEFIEPFASTADIELRMEPSVGGETHVTWAMAGGNDFMAKLFGLFMSWEDDIAADFDRGLERLEAAATATAN